MLRYMLLAILFLSVDAHALTCGVNCPSSRTTSITRALSASENAVGMSYQSAAVDLPNISYSGYNASQSTNWAITYPGNSVRSPGWSSTWTYFPVDDYIAVALAYDYSAANCGYIYAPSNTAVKVIGSSCDDTKTSGGSIVFGSALSRIKILKKLVNGTYSKNILVGIMSICQPGGPSGCSTQQLITGRIYLSLNITVPQTCTLNAGQVINVDFGNLSSGAFTSAGARAEGVNDIVRSIPIECDGIAANTLMTVRLQADKVSGNAVVTNTNNDVGFVVADSNGTPITPNNLSSVIPFTLDSYGDSNVTIRVYPVSVTGNKPAEGAVTSQAYLRVDFA